MLILSDPRKWKLIAAASARGGIVATDPVDTTGVHFFVGFTTAWTNSGVITDSKGNFWQHIRTLFPAAGLSMFVAHPTPATVGPGHTFASTTTFGGQSAVMVAGFATPRIYAVEQHVESYNRNPGLLTPSRAPSLLVTGCVAADATGIDSGFTMILKAPSVHDVSVGGAMAYLIQDVATPVWPTWSSNGNVDISMLRSWL